MATAVTIVLMLALGLPIIGMLWAWAYLTIKSAFFD
jgi:hypothetical protein